jgi:hypothetical protein
MTVGKGLGQVKVSAWYAPNLGLIKSVATVGGKDCVQQLKSVKWGEK